MQSSESALTVATAAPDTAYVVASIHTNDKEFENFLFTLGCFAGEEITVLSKLKGNFMVSIKDARYSIDEELANAIVLHPHA